MASDLLEIKTQKKQKAPSRSDARQFVDAALELGVSNTTLAILLGYTKQAVYDWVRVGTAPTVAVEAAKLHVANSAFLRRVKALESENTNLHEQVTSQGVNTNNLANEIVRLREVIRNLEVENARLVVFEKAPLPKPSTVVIATPRNEADKELLLAVCKGRINVHLLDPSEIK